MILTCELVLYFSPIYGATKQKADFCNSFKVVVQKDTRHTHRHIYIYISLPNALSSMLMFIIDSLIKSKTNKRGFRLKTIAPMLRVVKFRHTHYVNLFRLTMSVSLLEFCSRTSATAWWRRDAEVHSATKNVAKHAAKSLAHSTVDEEVEWICNCDAAIDEQLGRVACRVAEQIHVERIFDDDEQ